MKVNKKKGFTLVELVVVLAIIAVLSIIIVPTVTNSLKKGKEEYVDTLKNEMILVAQDYYTENIGELPRGQLDDDGNPILYKTISVLDLENENYATNKFVDANGNSCESSIVTITNINGKYNYNACVICGDTLYSTDNECSAIAPEPESEPTPVYNEPTCSIEVTSSTDTERLLTITGTETNVGGSITNIEMSKETDSSSVNVIVQDNIGTAIATTSGSYIAIVTNSNDKTGTCTITVDPIAITTYGDWSSYLPTPTCDVAATDICRTETIYRCELNGGRAVGDGYYCCWSDCSSTNPAYAANCTGGWTAWSTTHYGSNCAGWGIKNSETTTGYSSRTKTVTYN